MKISLSKFYQEITGKTTANLSTTTRALTRWGIPFDPNANKVDRVEVRFLDAARVKWQEETAAAAAQGQTNSHPGSGDSERMQKMRDAKAAKAGQADALKDIHAVLTEIRDQHGAALARVEEILNRIYRDLYGDKKHTG